VSADVIGFPERRIDGEPWEPWVTEPVIARHFAVSERTVRRWRELGMPSKLRGGCRRYRIMECERWLDEREGAA
jgi:hypothetical protein